ncbi:MAG: bifunctional phosphoribosylaminoimidazolecarboxamide formyltransferase/IMP cyclohydrolase [Candidatus Omnitrophica bacterium]|nr:bifunctional phosphoribosylaminoimidazolecarboxamide formyltransferase/IMP cyclohydrolase [Candidatus Omnitrophota bacterium]
MSVVPIRRALISVSDKTGLPVFAKALHKLKIEILSTGGTLKALKAEGIPAIPMEEFTGFPEILEGRVKTLHPKIHGGLLYRRNKKEHVTEAKKHQIEPIDLVVVNLYPFEQVIQKEGVGLETAIENIDIGGPSMLRSAAKNFDSVTVICDPADYGQILEEIKKNGGTTIELREKLAQKVFSRTSAYDHVIAGYLARQSKKDQTEGLPFRLDGVYDKVCDLRYGENPHQRAAFYQRTDKPPRFKFEQLHGKELSYNNYLDIEATIDILREFTEPAACIVKHNNPCGIAEDPDIAHGVSLAVECDSMSAFGGIIGINRLCDKKTAQEALDKLRFFEVFVAPSFDSGALKLLKERKNLRIITVDALEHAGGPYDLRFIKGGILLQDRDQPTPLHLDQLKKNLSFVTESKVSGSEIDDLIFAWKCVKVVKSNAIVITQGRQTVGIGAGQMSRVDSVEIACRKAGYRTDGGILASDAFFPMPDSIEEAARYKIRAIIQPGGSLRDADVIAACNRFGIAMAFTGARHFRH